MFMTTLERCTRSLLAGMAIALACILLASSSDARCAPVDDVLLKARETFLKSSSRNRIAAAQTLVASGKKNHRKLVVEALFDLGESPWFCSQLFSILATDLTGDDGRPLEHVERRVRKLAESGNPDKQLHGFRLAAWFGVGGLEDELDDVIEDALEVLLKKEEGAPKRADVLQQARTQIELAVKAYAAGAPEAPAFTEWLGVLCAREDADVRFTAFGALASLDIALHHMLLASGARDPDARIVKSSIETLLAWNDKRAIPALFAQLGDKPSEVDDEILPALFQMTGKRIHLKARWEAWWRSVGDEFAILSDDEYDDLVKKIVAARSVSQYGPSGSFFGLVPQRDSVVFLIDVSGSMNATHASVYSDDMFLPGTYRKTRLDVVKEQVVHALQGIGGREFDIVTFNSGVTRWSPRGSASFPTHEQALSSAVAYVGKLVPFGGTAMHAGLQTALSMDIAAEIFLLSDGSPSVGVTSENKIVGDVRRWNKKRKDPADLHCVGLGFESDLLVQLGAITDNSSVHIVK